MYKRQVPAVAPTAAIVCGFGSGGLAVVRARRAMVERLARVRSSMLTSTCSRLRYGAAAVMTALEQWVWRRGVARPDGGAGLRSTVNRSHASWKTTAAPRLAGRLHAFTLVDHRAASVCKILAHRRSHHAQSPQTEVGLGAKPQLGSHCDGDDKDKSCLLYTSPSPRD